ncbi:3-dehydroquinate synthase [Wenzhouxiangella sp. XN24]|uniref:3-dehydroquinate synthase n=1 Tax=Wenzhouxiangella sp. XN24 TaxID=2713569 RepID=UPI0013EAA1BB|nr:3-dehydroquinate synthase [Wenzhouxiangella sp. XN24]NGX17437.1 3-dehydroquinate synthase [Wenzhouxiangella sp. XN24]
MHALNVSLGQRSYPVLIGRQLLGRAEVLAPYLAGRQVMIVTNEIVAPLWLKPLRAVLAEHEVAVHVLPDGEDQKSLDSLAVLFDVLAEKRFNRDATIVTLGGGVIGDLGGFAAACWQRGISFVQIPTTLLAQVDAAVGGKTAVNIPAGKNLVGAFHQPSAVIADTATLGTLGRKEYCAGLGEVVKYGLGLEAGLFDWLEDNLAAVLDREPAALERLVYWCCAIKASVVAADEREHGQRALLNLGHTFAHAIEASISYGSWLHGEAVAVGLVMASELAVRLDMLDPDSVRRVRALLEAAGLPTRPPPVGAERLKMLMSIDKKIAAGRLRFILPTGIGSSVARDDVPEADLDAVLAMADGR